MYRRGMCRCTIGKISDTPTVAVAVAPRLINVSTTAGGDGRG